MPRTVVKTWQKHFNRKDFCRRLGFPEADAPDLLSAYVGITGINFLFVRLLDDSSGRTSLQWEEFRTKASVIDALDLPIHWKGKLVRFFIFSDDVELRFVDSHWQVKEVKEEKPSASSQPRSSWWTSITSRFRNRHP